MRKYISFIILLWPVITYSQEMIRLGQCLDNAHRQHARIGNFDMMEKIHGNELQNLNANWYPQLELNGSASYQSDVIQIGEGISLPGVDFPSPPQDQYKIHIDIRQTIYDAGVNAKKSNLEKMVQLESEKELQAELWREKSDVKELFFNILILKENIAVTRLTLSELGKSKEVLSSGVNHGLIPEADLKMLLMEKMSLEQEVDNLQSILHTIIGILQEKTGMELSVSDSFLLPDYTISETNEMNRIELDLFDIRKKQLNNSSDLLSSQRLPVLYAFSQLGYGKPGLNMLDDEFDSYYVVGAGLKWTIFDWNTVKRKKESLSFRGIMIENQKKDYEERLNEGLKRQLTEIQNHRKNISKYREILKIREEVTATYRAMLENETIRTIDYLKVLNDERRSRIRLTNENILYQKAIADYLYMSGHL